MCVMYKTLLDTIIGYFLLCRIIIGSGLLGTVNKITKRANSGILLIAWYLPPSISSGVYRPLSFIKYAGTNKINLSCLSGYLEEDILESGKYLEMSLPGNIPIKRVNKIDINPSWRFFPRIQQNVFIDAMAVYYEAIKIYDKHPPKVIIATGPPFSDFIAATFLAKRYSSKLVLDYRDEWSERPFTHIEKNLQDKFFEKWCLKNANAIIFTTESQILHQLTTFSYLKKNRCYYIPNGWDKDFTTDSDDSNLAQKNTSDYIIISFIGHLGAHTKPNVFFDCINKVIEKNKEIRIKIRFVGDIGSASRLSIENFKHKDLIEIIGHVSKQKAFSYMKESSLLLLIAENDLCRYRPGKLYDYLAAKRPILVYGSEGEVKDVVCNLNAGFYVKTGDSVSLENALLQSKTFLFNEKIKVNINEWMAKHERNVLAKSFFKIINSL